MSLLAIKYRSLQPTKDYLCDRVVLAQAWKKAHQYIRSTNWYADTFELDRSAIDLDSRIDCWIKELETNTFTFNSLRIVPAPKSERWHFHPITVSEDLAESHSHKWSPIPPENGKEPQQLRPLAHVSIRDQSLLMALMMCLADKVESSQGNTATPLDQVHKRKVVNYGNRLYCTYSNFEASFAWGNSTSYSKYFSDYQKFLERPIYFGAEALQQKTKDQLVYEVSLDIEKFYDCINRVTLINIIRDLCGHNNDPVLERLLQSFEAWKWDEKSPETYDLVCKKDKESIPDGIPQGLVAGGFLANIYLLDFDKKIHDFIGLNVSDEIQLIDYCRYVDDMRLIVVANRIASLEDIKKVINIGVMAELQPLGLKLNFDKTRVERFRYKYSGISTKLTDIQKKVSGPLSPSEIDEQLGHLEGLIGLAETLRSSPAPSIENTNPLATIESPSNDVRDDTLLRFSANKIHALLKQKRSFYAQEVGANGDPQPGSWDYLQERMARKFIACWSGDPSLVLLLKKGLELFPDQRILKPILTQLQTVLLRTSEPKQIKMAQYCLGEIFRHSAVFIHPKDSWAFPAHADVGGFFEYLQASAVEILSKQDSCDRNLLDQAKFYCLVRNDSPLDQETICQGFNVITKMTKGYRNILIKMAVADLVSNSVLAYQLARDKSQVIRSVSCFVDKALKNPFSPLSILHHNDADIFCKRIAAESPRFLTELVEHAKNSNLEWPDHINIKGLLDKTGLFERPILGDLNLRNQKKLSLLAVIKRKDNPFSHENAALALLLAVLNDGEFKANLESISDDAFEPSEIIDICNCKVSCDNWNKIQSLDINFRIDSSHDQNPLFPVPTWVETTHQPLYRLGMFLRSCLIGNIDWSSTAGDRTGKTSYVGLKSSFLKRQLGMMHSPEALNGETAPMSNWVSGLLFHLLQWPGTNIHEDTYDWPVKWDVKSLKKLVKKRLIEQKQLFCKMSGIPTYVEKLNLAWSVEKKSLKVVMVQSLLPLKGDFKEHGLMLDTPVYRARHRRHLASVAELILHKAYSQRSIDDSKYKDNSIDLIVWPELSVSHQDIDVLKQLADKTGAIIFAGLTFTTLDGIEGPNNVAQWLIPRKLSSGRQFMARLQGKQNLMKDEIGKVKSWRPYQLMVELVHPAFPKEPGFRLTGSICYDATDIKISADLKDKSDAYLVAALNQDVNTFDSMVDALYYHMYQHVVLVNTGEFGGSVAKAPYKEKHEKLILHVHGSHQVSISSFEMNMFDFREVGKLYRSGKQVKTMPAG